MAHYTLYGFDRVVKHDLCRVPMLSILFYRFSFIRTLKSRGCYNERQTNYCTMVINRRRRRKRQQKNRVFWVHPINARREEVGLFYTLFNDLRNY